MNLNRAEVIGRVTANPELKTIPSGQKVTTFSIATNYTYKTKEGKKEEVEFHTVVFWGKAAELICQYVSKGSMLFVAGRLRTRKWEKDGNKFKATEIIGEDFKFGPRPAGSQPREAAAPADNGGGEFDDIPVIDLADDIKAEDLPF